MRKSLMGLLVLLMLCTVSIPAFAEEGGHPQATKAIKALVSDFTTAWNKHDTKAMAALWTRDGDLINPWGRVAKGRKEVEKLFQDEHSSFLKGTTYTASISAIRFLGDDVGIVDWQGSITGMHDSKGSQKPPLDNRVTMVVVRREAGWKIDAARPIVSPPPIQ